MNLLGRYLARSLSTEKGSAGTELVLWSFMILIFVWLPIFSFVFEKFVFSAQANKWAAVLDNSLDGLEWQLETDALAQADRQVSISEVRLCLSQPMLELQIQNPEIVWWFESCQYDTSMTGGHPKLSVKLRVSYPAATFLGKTFSSDGRVEMSFDRLREMPYDR